jgi:hypothetical protein
VASEIPGLSSLTRLARRRRPSVQVRGAGTPVDADALDARLAGLGAAGEMARRLDVEAEGELGGIQSLSSLSTPLALEYLERLARPIPALTLEAGVTVVSRAYLAHTVLEHDQSAYGVERALVLVEVPTLRRGRPPQDLLNRVVKASRRGFKAVRNVPEPVWDGFVLALVCRVHEQPPRDEELLATEVVDGLARFGWVLRQVDLRYGLEPQRR